MVDIDPAAAATRAGLSPRDVNNALAPQNVILPTGTAKMGVERVPGARSTSSPETIDEIGGLADQDRERHAPST